MGDAAALPSALRSSTITPLQTLPDIVADPVALQQIVEQIICAED
jgi:hypothetical protein